MPREFVASRRVFRLVWVGIAVSYLVCGAVLAGYGLLYLAIWRYMFGLVFSVEYLGVNVQPGFFPYVGSATLVIALIHFYYVGSMLWRSIRARSLQLPESSSMGVISSRIGHAVISLVDSSLPPRVSFLGWMVRSVGDVIVGLWKAFDVTSPNYGVMYLVRELIQTAIQTNQAYQLSAHVASRGMNHTIVFLLVINCWSMPLIHYGLKIRSVPTVRLLCLVVNFALDFVAYFAFPIALFMPYTKEFDYTIASFPNQFWYKDVWIIQLMNEWPLVFTTSMVDGLSRLLIAFTMTRTLHSISKFLQQSTPGPKVGTGSIAVVHPTKTDISVAPRLLSSPSMARVTASFKRLPPVPVLRSRTEKWGHRVLVLWGLGVLVLHIQSSSIKDNPQCLLQVRPWFVRRPVCSLMEINCYDSDQLTGNAAHFDATLETIETKWLAYLVIRHCSSVEVTPRIHDLSWLMGIKIYNCTLLKWDDQAALTETHHPNMLFAFFVASNMSILPAALYHPDFPTRLRDIEFSFVNLSIIPTELEDRWPPGMFLVMEGLKLPSVPDVLGKLQPSYLSLACSDFSTIPDGVFENPELLGLNLNDNPISELPTRSDSLTELSMVGTLIAHVPSWLELGTAFLDAGSTPLCDALSQGDMSVLGTSIEAETKLWLQHVSCIPLEDISYLSNYPLAQESTNNPSKSS